MNPSNCSSVNVRELFHALLTDTSSAPFHQRLSIPDTLTAPPPKNFIRFIKNDQNNRREKYDGHHWRLTCTWDHMCTNLAYTRQLCGKHNLLRRNKELPTRKRKVLITHSSLPIMNPNSTSQGKNGHDDDEIQILEDYCTGPSNRHSMNSNIKTEAHNFHAFSVEHVDDGDLCNNIKSEPRASSSYRSSTLTTEDIEYVTSKTRSNGLNIAELISKNIPPLTDFEEEFLATSLVQKLPINSTMLDAQIYLHHEAMGVVKQNYQLKMDSVAPEYFYDFLLRHPRVALHHSSWFLGCKPVPPTTGCPIDTKVWTLSMIVRGATTSDHLHDR